MLILEINKYSLMVAAAVNMGFLSTRNLTSVDSLNTAADDDWGEDEAWDDWQDDWDNWEDFEEGDWEGFEDGEDGYAGEDEGGDEPGDGEVEDGDEMAEDGATPHPTGLPTPSPTRLPTSDGGRRRRAQRSQTRRRLRQSSTPFAYVHRKFLEHMDPVACLRGNGTEPDRCWIEQSSASEGLRLYPVMQASDPACRTCAGVDAAARKRCDVLNLDFYLFLNASVPWDPVAVEYDPDTDYEAQGASFIKLSFSGGTSFVNKSLAPRRVARRRSIDPGS